MNDWMEQAHQKHISKQVNRLCLTSEYGMVYFGHQVTWENISIKKIQIFQPIIDLFFNGLMLEM